jgi:hypothetical protein
MCLNVRPLLAALVLLPLLTAGTALSSHAQTLTFQQAVYVNGSTAVNGTVTEPTTGISIPNKLNVMLLVAKASNGAAYGRLSFFDARWKTMSSTSCTVNWSDITSDSATFRFRVAYATTGDWAFFTITKNLNADGSVANYSLDLTVKNYYLTTTWITYPTSYLSASDVSLTPPQ